MFPSNPSIAIAPALAAKLPELFMKKAGDYPPITDSRRRRLEKQARKADRDSWSAYCAAHPEEITAGNSAFARMVSLAPGAPAESVEEHRIAAFVAAVGAIVKRLKAVAVNVYRWAQSSYNGLPVRTINRLIDHLWRIQHSDTEWWCSFYYPQPDSHKSPVITPIRGSNYDDVKHDWKRKPDPVRLESPYRASMLAAVQHDL